MAGAEVATKYFVTIVLIGVVGYVDWISGDELSYSIFYLLPIAYATWFISARSGAFTAMTCASIWFTVEVANHGAYSSEFVPIWNAGVRLGFFFLGVTVVAQVKRTEVELIREVARRTRTLRIESERRRWLEREMVEVSAREQVRMAQHLHDGLGQYLSALAFHARMLADDLRAYESRHIRQAERIMELIRTTNQSIRRLDRALRVPESGAGGLVTAVRALAVEFEQLTGVRCQLHSNGAALSLDEFRTMMIFRIVQEAFSNAVKHDNPREIRVCFCVNEEMLRINVDHDGHGEVTPSPDGSGSGLGIMKLRAELIGATLEFGPGETGNYRVRCLLPLSPDDLVAEGTPL
jgi:signal transduction histidine kinase